MQTLFFLGQLDQAGMLTGLSFVLLKPFSSIMSSQMVLNASLPQLPCRSARGNAQKRCADKTIFVTTIQSIA